MARNPLQVQTRRVKSLHNTPLFIYYVARKGKAKDNNNKETNCGNYKFYKKHCERWAYRTPKRAF